MITVFLSMMPNRKIRVQMGGLIGEMLWDFDHDVGKNDMFYGWTYEELKDLGDGRHEIRLK